MPACVFLEKIKKFNADSLTTSYSKDNRESFNEICQNIKAFNQNSNSVVSDIQNPVEKEFIKAQLRAEITILTENLDWEQHKVARLEKRLTIKNAKLSDIKSNKSKLQLWSGESENDLQAESHAIQKDIAFLEILDAQALEDEKKKEIIAKIIKLERELSENSSDDQNEINLKKQDLKECREKLLRAFLKDENFSAIEQMLNPPMTRRMTLQTAPPLEVKFESEDQQITINATNLSEYREALEKIIQFKGDWPTEEAVKCRQTYLKEDLTSLLNAPQLLANTQKYIPINVRETPEDYLVRMCKIIDFKNTYDSAASTSKPTIPPDLKINNLDQAAQAKPFYDAYLRLIGAHPAYLKLLNINPIGEEEQIPDYLLGMKSKSNGDAARAKKIEHLLTDLNQEIPLSFERQAIVGELKQQIPQIENEQDYDYVDKVNGLKETLKQYLQSEESVDGFPKKNGENTATYRQRVRDAVATIENYQRLSTTNPDSFVVYSSVSNPIQSMTFQMGTQTYETKKIPEGLQTSPSLYDFKAASDAVEVTYANGAVLKFKKDGKIIVPAEQDSTDNAIDEFVKACVKRLKALKNPAITLSNLDTTENQRVTKSILINKLVYFYCVDTQGNINLSQFKKIKEILLSKNHQGKTPAMLTEKEIYNDPAYKFLLDPINSKEKHLLESAKAFQRELRSSQLSQNDELNLTKPSLKTYKERLAKGRTWSEYFTGDKKNAKNIKKHWTAIFTTDSEKDKENSRRFLRNALGLDQKGLEALEKTEHARYEEAVRSSRKP